MAASIFNGTFVKLLKSLLNIGDAVYILPGTADPSAVATDAPKGSLYINTSTAVIYKKQDNGSTTNWIQVVSASETQTLLNKTLTAPVISNYDEYTEVAAPSSPAAGKVRVYAKADKLMYQKDSAGLETPLGIGPNTVPTSALQDTVEVLFVDTMDFSGNSTTLAFPQYPWSAPVKLTNPTTLPAGSPTGCSFSMNSEYLVVSHATTPFITIYQRKANEFVKIADPATLPASTGEGVAWSNNTEFLAVAHQTTPFVTIYQRSGNVFTKLTNPATLPAAAGRSVAWSPNGEFLAVGHQTTPFVTIYQRSGTTFTKLANPATLPPATGTGVAWSPDGRFLCVCSGSSPFLTIYERTANTTFTKLADPATIPAGSSAACAFSLDGKYLALANGVTPFITVYERSGTTFTKIADPATLPTGTSGTGIAFSANGRYVALTTGLGTFMVVYDLSSGLLVKLADPATLPTGNGDGASWSSDNQFLAISHSTSPQITIYQTAGDMPANAVVTLKKINRSGV